MINLLQTLRTATSLVLYVPYSCNVKVIRRYTYLYSKKLAPKSKTHLGVKCIYCILYQNTTHKPAFNSKYALKNPQLLYILYAIERQQITCIASSVRNFHTVLKIWVVACSMCLQVQNEMTNIICVTKAKLKTYNMVCKTFQKVPQVI